MTPKVCKKTKEKKGGWGGGGGGRGGGGKNSVLASVTQKIVTEIELVLP